MTNDRKPDKQYETIDIETNAETDTIQLPKKLLENLDAKATANGNSLGEELTAVLTQIFDTE